MQSNREHISLLWKLYLTDQASDEQVKELLEFVNNPANDADNELLFRQSMDENVEMPEQAGITVDTEHHWRSMLTARESLQKAWEAQQGPFQDSAERQIGETTDAMPKRIHFLRTAWFRYAAVALIVLGVTAWLITTHEKKVVDPALSEIKTKEDIAPGKNGAILTLADGSRVVLDSAGNGVIAQQHGTAVVLKNGELTYQSTGASAGTVAYNTMVTPKGRQFRISLPDGTLVWLNAASSIRYPTLFTGHERKVDVTGEAYFEVAKNAAMPFRIQVNNQASIEVLGTHFNVNAYENENSINTTLVEGSVKVQTGQATAHISNVVLKPGQQAQVSRDNPSIVVKDHANLDKVMAWKNGLFNFDGASLREVMRELERWYDIDVVYEKGIPELTFGGKITKGVSLNGILSGLEKSEVHFRLEGRTLIVQP